MPQVIAVRTGEVILETSDRNLVQLLSRWDWPRHCKERHGPNFPGRSQEQPTCAGSRLRLSEEAACTVNHRLLRASKYEPAWLQRVLVCISPREQHAQLLACMAQDGGCIGV